MAGLYDSAGSVNLPSCSRRTFADFLFRAVLDLTFKGIMIVQPGLGSQIDASMSSSSSLSSSKEIAPKKSRTTRLICQLFTRAKFSAETIEVLRIHFNAERLSSLCIVKRLCSADPFAFLGDLIVPLPLLFSNSVVECSVPGPGISTQRIAP